MGAKARKAKIPPAKPQSHAVYAWLAVVLVVLTVLVYLPALNGQFLGYDDDDYITNNPHVQGGLTVAGVKWAFTSFHASNWHPLTWLSHMLDVRLYGLNPLGHHLTSLLLHLANVLLLFWVLSRMTGAVWRSAFVAALFAIHPLHVESVAWVAERKDVLSTLFWLLTVLAYVAYARKGGAARYALVVVSYALGLMAKPMLVSLPIVLLMLDWWPLERLGRSALRQVRPLLEKAPLFALAAGSCVVTLAAQNSAGAVFSVQELALGQRLMNAFVSYVMYLRNMFWPTGLACYYPSPDYTPVWQGVAAGLVLAAVSYMVFRLRRQRYLAAGWLWYLVTLVPVIGLVQVGSQAMADRYTYIPLIGPFIMIAWGVPDLIGRGAQVSLRQTRALGAAAVVVIILLAASARVYVGFWHDTVTLCRRAVSVTTDNAVAQETLGAALCAVKQPEEAVTHLEEALRIYPGYAEAESNLGNALVALGKVNEATEHFEKATKLAPRNPLTYFNLATNLAARRMTDRAIFESRKAIELDPGFVDAHVILGTLLADQGHIDEAVSHFNTAIRMDANHAMAHNNLAVILATQGNLQAAVEHLRMAIQADPNYLQARYGLAEVLDRLGRPDEAQAQRQEADRIRQTLSGERR